MNKRARGELGERIASAFLAVKGYEILRSNLRFARREIDILARRGDVLVAVEVKLRVGTQFGTAAEAVDQRKLGRIGIVLQQALRDIGVPATRPRIDVVAIDIAEDFGSMVVNHIEGVY